MDEQSDSRDEFIGKTILDEKSMSNEIISTCIFCNSDRISQTDAIAELSQCKNCGLVFNNPRPSQKAIANFYSKPGQYDSWTANLLGRTEMWLRRLKKMQPYLKRGRLLDIGAGIGQFMFLAKSEFNAITGTEVSLSAIQVAEKEFGIDLHQGSIESIDLPKESFDTVTAFHVLEHVPHPGLFLKRCHDLLVPGGRLFIAVPNDLKSAGAWLRKVRFRFGLGLPGFGAFGLPRISLDGSMDELHLSHFDESSLKIAFEKSGFIVKDCGLDPFWAEQGGVGRQHQLRYWICEAIKKMSDQNIYGTIWICGEKV